MKTKTIKYPTMPLYIIKVGKGFKNTHSGLFLSDKEIEAYISPKEVKTKDKEHKLSHETIIERRWDLRID